MKIQRTLRFYSVNDIKDSHHLQYLYAEIYPLQMKVHALELYANTQELCTLSHHHSLALKMHRLYIFF
jgi:hypothetical protein